MGCFYMSYAIMRIEKRNVGNITGMFKHNERKNENYSNEDINKKLSKLNYQLIECNSYKDKINNEIKERYKINKTIRKDAVLCAEFIFTSDKEFFDKLTLEQERLYFEKSVEFLKENFGEKNVVFATVHKDETTPHLHAGIVPITEDGRLSYKSFVNGKLDLIKLQDKYYEKMNQFFPMLERGKNVKETKSKHIENREYKMSCKEKELEKLEESFKLTEAKYYALEAIKEHVKENKSIFQNKITVSMSKEVYESLLKYAVEGERNLKDSIEIENKLEEYGKVVKDRFGKMEQEIIELKIENKDLKNKNIELENRVEEIKELEGLKKWLPKEMIEKFKKEQVENKNCNRIRKRLNKGNENER